MPLYSSSSTPNFQAFAPLQPSQWRQRIVHTHTFKIYEYGNAPADLVEEVDSSGHSRGRSLEHFFNGIVGHARDRHGNQVDSWHQATQLANYWRRRFGVPEDSRSYHDHNPDDGAEPTDVTPAKSSGHNHPACLAITQYFVPGPCRQRVRSIDLEHGITGFARPVTFEL